jgi:hypothetical protein
MKFLSQINVNTEYTLPIVDGTNGQVLATDGNGTAYWGSISAGATNLDALTDVILTSPSSGQLLRYGIPPGSGEAQPVWYNFTPNYLTPSSSIDNLGDVTITSAAAGQVLQWNGTAWVNATLSTVDYVSKVQHLVKCGVAVTKGQAVYVTSADGTNMIVGLASNASEATSSKVIGLAVSTGAINDQIFVVTEGLIAGLNTSTANAGDPVWLGTGGNLIFGLLNKPVAPAHLVYLGVVTRVQQNNGEIFVNVQNGFELHELHDVLISSPSTGQLIRRDSDGLWKNWTPNYLTSLPTHNHDDRYYTESEIIAFFGGETEIAGYNQTNWDTAYGWGNHATAGYATQAWVGLNYYNEGEIDDFFSGAEAISGYNKSNWDTAYNDKISSASFSTSTGVLTLTQQDTGTITVDLDGRYLESLPSHTHAASDITSGTLSTDRLPKQELGISIQGNFGQWEPHGTYTNLNTDVAYWGWSFVQGNTNAPHSGSQQWYRGRFSLGDAYGNGSASGDYWMEIAIPRYNQGSNSGNLFVRTCENGTINGWQGVRAAFATDADTLDGQHGSYYQAASSAITTSNIGSQSVAYAGEAGFVSNQGGQLLRFDNRTISPSETNAGYLQFGFTSWANNNTGVWADYLHLRSYTDGSGGNDNLVMFKKDGIGMRIWQQSFGSTTAYSSYADVWTTGDFSSTNVSNWNAAYNDRITAVAVSGTGTKTLTLTQQDGGTLTATWTDFDSDTDQQELTWEQGTSTLSISNGNAVILSGFATEDYVLSQGFVTSAGTVAGVVRTVTGTNSAELVRGNMGDNDQARILVGATASNAGYLEIATADDGTEPIYVRQYTGTFVTEARTATLLDGSGNTTFPGTVTAGRYRGHNSIILNNYTTVNPSSNVFLYSQPNDRDAWIFLDSADTGSNWGIYHRQIDSAVGDIPGNSIGFVGGGSSTLQGYINLSNGDAYFRGNLTIGGTFTENSSIRFKENIQPLEPALSKVEQLNPVTYTKITSQEEEIGLIAEEVAELFPEVVTYNESGQPQGIQYQRLSVILLKAMQELSNEVKALKAKLK